MPLEGQEGQQAEGQAGEQQQAAPSWFDALPDDMKSNEALAGYKDKPADLAKAYLNTQGKLATALVKPADDAPQEVKDAYSKQLREATGVPADVTGYEIAIPEGVPVDEAFVANAKQWALDAGMGKEAFAQFAGKYIEAQKSYMEQAEQAHKQELASAVSTLQKEWGPKYEENKRAALNAVEKLSGKEVADWMNENFLLMRTFYKVSQLISEDTLSGAGSGGVAAQGSMAKRWYPNMA